MEPTETLFLESTTKTNLEDIPCCSFITFQVYDCSGQIDLFSDTTCDSNALLKGCGSLIFVIDAQVNRKIFLIIFFRHLSNLLCNYRTKNNTKMPFHALLQLFKKVSV